MEKDESGVLIRGRNESGETSDQESREYTLDRGDLSREQILLQEVERLRKRLREKDDIHRRNLKQLEHTSVEQIGMVYVWHCVGLAL